MTDFRRWLAMKQEGKSTCDVYGSLRRKEALDCVYDEARKKRRVYLHSENRAYTLRVWSPNEGCVEEALPSDSRCLDALRRTIRADTIRLRRATRDRSIRAIRFACGRRSSRGRHHRRPTS